MTPLHRETPLHRPYGADSAYLTRHGTRLSLRALCPRFCAQMLVVRVCLDCEFCKLRWVRIDVRCAVLACAFAPFLFAMHAGPLLHHVRL